jgi:hypothetical protein
MRAVCVSYEAARREVRVVRILFPQLTTFENSSMGIELFGRQDTTAEPLPTRVPAASSLRRTPNEEWEAEMCYSDSVTFDSRQRVRRMNLEINTTRPTYQRSGRARVSGMTCVIMRRAK